MKSIGLGGRFNYEQQIYAMKLLFRYSAGSCHQLRVPLEGELSWLLKPSALTDPNGSTMFTTRSCSGFQCNKAVQIMIFSHVPNALLKLPATHGKTALTVNFHLNVSHYVALQRIFESKAY